jgi:hypothetical protein
MRGSNTVTSLWTRESWSLTLKTAAPPREARRGGVCTNFERPQPHHSSNHQVPRKSWPGGWRHRQLRILRKGHHEQDNTCVSHELCHLGAGSRTRRRRARLIAGITTGRTALRPHRPHGPDQVRRHRQARAKCRRRVHLFRVIDQERSKGRRGGRRLHTDQGDRGINIAAVRHHRETLRWTVHRHRNRYLLDILVPRECCPIRHHRRHRELPHGPRAGNRHAGQQWFRSDRSRHPYELTRRRYCCDRSSGGAHRPVEMEYRWVPFASGDSAEPGRVRDGHDPSVSVPPVGLTPQGTPRAVPHVRAPEPLSCTPGSGGNLEGVHRAAHDRSARIDDPRRPVEEPIGPLSRTTAGDTTRGGCPAGSGRRPPCRNARTDPGVPRWSDHRRESAGHVKAARHDSSAVVSDVQQSLRPPSSSWLLKSAAGQELARRLD